jgi:hypothetical protein
MYTRVLCNHKEEKKIMSFSGKWMELEISMLSEISQIEKGKYIVHVFPHIWSLVGKS